MKIFISLLFLTITTILAIRNNNSLGIIGGTLMYPHSRPYMVFLDMTGSNLTRCGANLITKNYVLTAARCLKNSATVRVVLGADNVTEAEDTQVSLDTAPGDFIIHDDFNETSLENDIALIKLPQTVTLNENIQTIPVAREGEITNLTDRMVVAAGWGVTYYRYPESVSDVPEAMWLYVLPNKNSECDDYFGDLIKDTNICCSARNSWSYPLNLCDGDWGGPLVLNDTKLLVGVASFTSVYCGMGYPNVFTDVSKYTDWIKANSDLE